MKIGFSKETYEVYDILKKVIPSLEIRLVEDEYKVLIKSKPVLEYNDANALAFGDALVRACLLGMIGLLSAEPSLSTKLKNL